STRAVPRPTLFPYTTLFRSVAGEGQPGIGGGPRGDLFLVIGVKPDPVYERKGDDLYIDIDVDLVKMILGGEVLVPTPDGRKLIRSEEHTSELQSLAYLVCRL